jgi:serine/threonine-protein kinase
MMSDFGQVYVMDWGVARVAPGSSRRREANLELGHPDGAEANPDPPGALIGTPCYMAPEQLMGKHDELDERTDVFALGAILYQILAGQPPRLPNSLPTLMMRKGRMEIPPPEQIATGIPAELSRIALKAMAHEPAGRYPSVNDLKKDIEQFQRGAWHLPRAMFCAGAVIICEGEPGESAYIIVEGRCVAFRSEATGEVLLREMGPGDVFGETAVFSNKPRSASVKAITDVVLMVVTGDILSSALGLNFWMGSFVKALAERFREVDERLRQLEKDERQRSGR